MDEVKLKYNYVRRPTELPSWWPDMHMLPVPLEADVGVRITLKRFFDLVKNTEDRTDCTWYTTDQERLFDFGIFDWKLAFYGPFSRADMRSCKDLTPQDYIFYALRSGMLVGTPPSDWPHFITIDGKYDSTRKGITYYVERSTVRYMRINDVFFGLPHGVPNRKSSVRPTDGSPIGKPQMPPIVMYVHDTYSKFSDNGRDDVNRFFRGLVTS